MTPMMNSSCYEMVVAFHWKEKDGAMSISTFVQYSHAAASLSSTELSACQRRVEFSNLTHCIAYGVWKVI